jgi:hypothetical protein
VLFKGHLSGLYPFERLEAILYKQGVLLKEYKDFALSSIQQLREHIKEMAQAAGRPVQYLTTGFGKSGESKEAMALAIAERDQITEGLIVVFSSLELNQALTVRTEPGTGHLHLVSEKRKQLHWYLYYLDNEFGLMFVCIQSWWPFTIQIYINGHEWLAKQMDREGIGYERADNCFWMIADLERAQALCDKFAHRQWERVWQAFADRIDQITARGYTPHIDDGVLINMAPLWDLIPAWPAEPKKCWQALERGDYDWSHTAMDYWPDRVKEKCRENKSYAIAHGLDD